MENAAGADPSIEAVDVAVAGTIVATAMTASTTTTAAVAKSKPKVKVKKEATATEREVQNQKRQARRVAQWARKAEAVTAALEEERRERLTIMANWAQAQEAMKLHELVGEAKTDTMAGTASSSLVTSQALRPLMVPCSPATPRASATLVLEVHAPSWLGGTRSSSRELPLMMDRVAPLAIDLNHTPAHVGSAQATCKRPLVGPPAATIHARALFDELTTPTPTDMVWSNILVLRLFAIYEGGITPNCT
jgi:hypothetical protein